MLQYLKIATVTVALRAENFKMPWDRGCSSSFLFLAFRKKQRKDKEQRKKQE